MADDAKTKKHRSPAYPFLSLKEAVERAKQVHKKEIMHAASVPVMAGHWGFKAKSSGGIQTAAALKQYGLMEESSGSGAERRVKLTDLARQIVLQPKGTSGWVEAVKRAALKPSLYSELFAKWGADLPSDENFRTHLALDRNFNGAVVEGVISNYKDTLSFSGLSESGTMSSNESSRDDDEQQTDGFGGGNMDSAQHFVGKPDVSAPLKLGVRLFSWPLAKGVTAEVRLSGGEVKASHLEMLRQYLELAKTAIDSDGE